MNNVSLALPVTAPYAYRSVAILCGVLIALAGWHSARAQGDIDMVTGVSGNVIYVGNSDAHGQPFMADRLIQVSKDPREGTFRHGDNRPHDLEIYMETGFVYVVRIYSYVHNLEAGLFGYESLDPTARQARAYTTMQQPFWYEEAGGYVFWSELAYHPYWDGPHYLRIAPPWGGGDYYVDILKYRIERDGGTGGGSNTGSGGDASTCTCEHPWEDYFGNQCVHKDRPEYVDCEDQY